MPSHQETPKKLLESTALCLTGLVTFGAEPDGVPRNLFDTAWSMTEDLVEAATLSVSAFSPVDVCVTDPLGRRVGTTPEGTFAEIPGAAYQRSRPRHPSVPRSRSQSPAHTRSSSRRPGTGPIISSSRA